MKKIVLFLLFCACSMSGRPVTMEAFYEVDIATTKEELVEMLGEPYSIEKKGDGSMEYEYIERIKIGARDAEERHYIIVLKEGRVVSKRVKTVVPLPYTFDSYDMQTTDNASNLE